MLVISTFLHAAQSIRITFVEFGYQRRERTSRARGFRSGRGKPQQTLTVALRKLRLLAHVQVPDEQPAGNYRCEQCLGRKRHEHSRKKPHAL